METKQSTLIFQCGSKKAAIFSIDAALGVFIAIIILAAASYYSSSTESSLELKQLQRVGYDVVSTLNYYNIYSTLDNMTIHNKTINITPVNYDIKLNITGNFPAGNIKTNSTIDYNTTIVSGEIPVTFLNISTNTRYYASVRFFIWPK